MTRVYHGSLYQFDQFDFSKMRMNGTAHGVGFYMTDNKAMAESYATTNRHPKGYLYEIDFHGQTALSSTDLTLSDENLTQLLEVLHERCDFLWDIDDLSRIPYKEVLKKALHYMKDSDDVETIAGMINSCGDAELVLNTLHELFGYDCIIVPLEDQTFYIATVNEAITMVSCTPVERR